MATIKLKGNPVQTKGNLPSTGSQAPDFKLTGSDLSTISLTKFKGQKVVLNIFPSLDTSTCAASVRQFNKEAASLSNVTVLCISKDLPFAHSRFCTAEGIDKVVTLSEFKDNNFSSAYGVLITDGPLEGLMSRAVVTLDAYGKVLYTEQVPEITQEPDYEKALASIR